MTAQLFSFSGYVSIILWLLVPLMWALHHFRRPRGYLCHFSVLVAVLALIFAMVNSRTYVNRIQIDRSEEIAAAQAQQEAARRAAEEARGGEVAQVRFAEDDATDYLDEAGMDDADRKYMASFSEDATPQASQAGGQATPDWKKEKKTRSQTPAQDDSLESMIDTSTDDEAGVDTGEVEEAAAEPIMMPEKYQILANRLDGGNLKLTRLLVLLSLGVVIVDYLRRVNTYEDAYFPLPLPSMWVNAQAPLAALRSLPEQRRRNLPAELAWLTRRGDAFLYLTDDARDAEAVPERLPRLPRGRAPLDVLHVDGDDGLLDDAFIFEGLWYKRASFVIGTPERAEAVLASVVETLKRRRASRARVAQTVHIVWDQTTPIPEALREELLTLAPKTGWSILECA